VTLPALHPEDLIDRERHGALSADERSALDLHTAACAACAFHRGLAGELAREKAVAGSHDKALAARAVKAALAELGASPHRGFQDAGARPGRRRLATAAALVLAGIAATSSWAAWRVRNAAATRGFTPAIAAIDPIPTERTLPNEDIPVAPAETPPPVVAPDEPGRASAGRSAPPGPAALFARANRLRSQGQAAAAQAAYRDLQRRFPASDEGLVSRVALGRLYLDRLSQPGRALGQFDSYLADSAGNPLREAALVGRALALGRLGRVVEERRAWTALLAEFPDSMYAEAMKRRLVDPR
jgi:hypothetical protein